MIKFFFYTMLLWPAITLAAATVGDPKPPAGASHISSPGELTGPISNIIAFLGSLTLAIAVILFIYAGFLYITAGDSEKDIDKAKSILMYGIIGIAVAIIAGGIPLLVQNMLG